MTLFSKRILATPPSPTLEIDSRAKSLKADGKDVISLAAGQPDFNTPEPIIEAAYKAMNQGHTGYLPSAGLPALREAIAQDYKLRNRNVEAQQVIVTVGGKQALYNAAQILLDANETMLIPAPYWVSYPAHAQLAGAEVQFIEPNADLKIDAPLLKKALLEAKNPKILVLCSPSNPTGIMYTEQELKALGAVLKDYPDTYVFFDAIYDRLCYTQTIAPDFVACNPELESRVLTFNGFSKTYAMTGWRLGYCIATKEIISKMAVLQSQSTSNATSFAQYGALKALELPQSEISVFVKRFKERQETLLDILTAIPEVTVTPPQGAFYLFADLQAYIGPNKRFSSCQELVSQLLEETFVAAVHGDAFGAPGFVRFSYANNIENIKEAGKRLKSFLGN